jgi:exonuclease SbcD
MPEFKPWRLLHTSDWHLGRPLYGRRRYREYAAFLDWLAETITREEVDVLAVAGDIFDSSSPATRAQALYYRFLARLAGSDRRVRVLIIAGNHDSPALLEAPGDLLAALDIHVAGTISRDDRLVTLRDEAGTPRLLAALAPYPRERDLRESEPGESLEDKERKLLEALAGHYRRLGDLAGEADRGIPKAALGHLFAAGGLTTPGDGVRPIYVGGLGQVPAGIFPPVFDYVALGHLHQPQVVAGQNRLRYSGSPLRLSFDEPEKPKSVTLVDFTPEGPAVRTLDVPVFQVLRRLKGDRTTLAADLAALGAESPGAWVEAAYTGDEIVGDLRENLSRLAGEAGLELLRLMDVRRRTDWLSARSPAEDLAALEPDEIFSRRLEAAGIPEADRDGLWAAYGEIRADLAETPPY